MQQCDDGETIYQVTKKVEILKKMNFHLQESPSPGETEIRRQTKIRRETKTLVPLLSS